MAAFGLIHVGGRALHLIFDPSLWPALWGAGGAFIYAGPRWVLALVGSPEKRAHPIIATLDLVICLAVGAICAAAFSTIFGAVVLRMLHVSNNNASCTVIGMFANRLAPSIVEKGASAVDTSSSLVVRVLQAIRGAER